MAARHDHRQADRRDGQGAAVSRRVQRLDHADQGAHRHAGDRHPHAGRRQGATAPISPRWRRSPARSRRRCARCRERPAPSPNASLGGYYLNIDPDRAQLARYGLMIDDVQDVIATALGAEAVTTTVEGRERYTVSIRYPRDLRSDPQAIATQVLIPLPNGGTVPLGEVAKVELAKGPSTIRTENAQLAAYIYRRSARPRYRRLRGRRAEGGGGTGQVPARLLRHLERAVRIHGTRQGAPQDRRADHAADHLPAALSQLPAGDRDPDRHAVGAVRARRRPVADVVARLQPVGRGRGRLHRAGRCRGRNRRGDADLSRQRAAPNCRRSAPSRATNSPATISTPRS